MEQIWTLESDYVGTMEARVNGGGGRGGGAEMGLRVISQEP